MGGCRVQVEGQKELTAKSIEGSDLISEGEIYGDTMRNGTWCVEVHNMETQSAHILTSVCAHVGTVSKNITGRLMLKAYGRTL